MKRIPPFINSMRGHLFVLLTLGIIGSAVISYLLTRSNHEELLTNARANHLASEIGTLVETLETTPPQDRDEILRLNHPMGVHGRLNEDAPPSAFEIDLPLQKALNDRLGVRRKPLASIHDLVPCRLRKSENPAHIQNEHLCQLVLMQLTDGTPLRLTVRRPPTTFTPLGPNWVVLLPFFCFIALLSWFVARIATRPLQQLAEAADKLDLTVEGVPLQDQGSSEVHAAIRAFNRMRQRIRTDIHERTVMLAAITHDLQTPLTRLRLRLEKVSDEELRLKLIADMIAIQRMLQEGLDFAHSLETSEREQKIDVDSLLDSLCSDASDSGQAVRYLERCPVQARVRPLVLRRALVNLLDNAVKYGQRADVSMRSSETECTILIRDYGAGIPESELEKVIVPFYRLEETRSRKTGGSGLGLAIARNILRQHGGSVTLINHAQGGLVAQIVLPFNHHHQDNR